MIHNQAMTQEGLDEIRRTREAIAARRANTGRNRYETREYVKESDDQGLLEPAEAPLQDGNTDHSEVAGNAARGCEAQGLLEPAKAQSTVRSNDDEDPTCGKDVLAGQGRLIQHAHARADPTHTCACQCGHYGWSWRATGLLK